MTYARTDDNYFDSPGIALLSDRAFRVHFKAWGYCARNLSDGFVPFSVAVPLGAKQIAELVQRGLWQMVPDGYHLPDFLVVNDSREVVEARRKKDADRKRSERNPDGVHSDTQEGESARSPGVEGSGEGVVVGLAVHKPQPRRQGVSDHDFDLFWEHYPRREGKGAARTALDKAATKAPLGTILQAAARFGADPNLPDDRTKIAHPATWLNQERWNDDPLPERNGHKPSPHRLDQIASLAREAIRNAP